ncbi:MAG: hypothetical protein IJ682_09800 [Lachnospiraceae bacterium]|nr:hypothetical protein [Lachnospiraceae bacterium]
MREIGYSNKVFYYNGAGHSTTYDFRMRILLTKAPDKEALKRAAAKTMAVFPEFAVRPVIGIDGKLYYEDNDAEVAIFDEADAPHALGSDETNGYLLCLICGEQSFILSFYHGLSDFVGNWSFICTLVWHYVRETGETGVSADEAVRLNADVYRNMDEQERDDPYRKFGNADSKPSWVYEDKGALEINETLYPDEADHLKNYEITLDVGAFLDKTKEIGTSFVPLLITTATQALSELYETDGKPVVVKIPTNLRPLYGTHTSANFSDSLVLTLSEELRTKPVAEQAKYLRSSMNDQRHRENFDRILAKKVKAVQDYESSGETIEQLNRRLTNAASAASARPVTFALTYPGRLEVPDEYQPVVRGFNMEPYVPTNGFFLFVGSYGKELRIRICQRFDSVRLAQAMAEAFKRIGLDASLRDAGTVVGDKVYVEKLKHI